MIATQFNGEAAKSEDAQMLEVVGEATTPDEMKLLELADETSAPARDGRC